jgi:hypothetical protein
MGRESGKGEVSLTLRQHLEHVKACETSGETLKSYAQRRGLSAQALYQSKKVARQRGLLPPHRGSASKKAQPKRSGPSRFVEAVRSPVIRESGPAWRLRFVGGELLECSTPLEIEDVLRIAERLGGRS